MNHFMDSIYVTDRKNMWLVGFHFCVHTNTALAGFDTCGFEVESICIRITPKGLKDKLGADTLFFPLMLEINGRAFPYLLRPEDLCSGKKIHSLLPETVFDRSGQVFISFG